MCGQQSLLVCLVAATVSVRPGICLRLAGNRFVTVGNQSYSIVGARLMDLQAVDHPNAPPPSNVVRMDVFYSMWRSRTVDCPWASGSPACETLLLHHEQVSSSTQ
jgi:hypothetical protein